MLRLIFWLPVLLHNAAASNLTLGAECKVDDECASGRCLCKPSAVGTTSAVSRTSPLRVLTLGAGALCLWRESSTGVLAALFAAEHFGLAWGNTEKCSCAPSLAFDNWKSAWGKKYADDEAEFAAYARWLAKDKYINDHNKKNSSFQMAHNHLSDLARIPKGHTVSKYQPLPAPIKATVVLTRRLAEGRRATTPPNSIDWAAQGKVTAVKEQGQCDSCWTFASTGAMESAYAIEQNTEPFDLSPQQLVACNTGTSNFVNGEPTCSVGGNIADAFLYAGAANSETITVGMWNKDYFTMTIKEVGWTDQMPKTTSILQYSAYPYTGGCVNGCSSGDLGCSANPSCQPPMASTQTCLLDTKSSGDATASLSISSFVWVETEADLLAAVARQPVAVSIFAGAAVQSYGSGVLDTTDCTGMTDHAVLVVGYGSDGTVDYWKIKNSWSTLWGEAGYFRMVRGKNMCGLGDQSKNSIMAYPTGATRSGTYTPPTPAPMPAPTPAPPSSQQPWANPSTGACGVGTDISQPVPVTTSSGTASLTTGAPQGAPCSPSCTNGEACPSFPGTAKNPYPYCYYTSSYGKWCALLCGANGWNCPSGMSCSSSSSMGTCKY